MEGRKIGKQAVIGAGMAGLAAAGAVADYFDRVIELDRDQTVPRPGTPQCRCHVAFWMEKSVGSDRYCSR
jgi:cation diffusion facilitator CzcD-associated flavoprotein CzcO